MVENAFKAIAKNKILKRPGGDKERDVDASRMKVEIDKWIEDGWAGWRRRIHGLKTDFLRRDRMGLKKKMNNGRGGGIEGIGNCRRNRGGNGSRRTSRRGWRRPRPKQGTSG